MSIKRKLILITMFTSALAVVLASVGFVGYDLLTFRRQLSYDLLTQAEVIGVNSTAALAFRDSRAATELLAALKSRNDVEGAALFTPDGQFFVQYRRDPSVPRALPPRPETGKTSIVGDSLHLFHDITLKGQTLGTVYLESRMEQSHERVRRYAGIVGVLTFGASVFALLLSTRLQRMISEPILRLQETMREVSADKNFSLRAVKSQRGEIGTLIDGFNEMLSEIQERDAALQGANQNLIVRTKELEQEIAERLRTQEELKTLNATLESRVRERSAAVEQRAQELARSEEALQKQTRILQSILHGMSDGVVVADEEARVILVNPAAEQMLHLTLHDTPSDEWAERYGLHLPDMVTHYPSAQFPLMQAIRGQSVNQAEMFVSQSPGEDGIWLSANATPLVDEGGFVHNGVGVFHDITGHKRAKEELLKAKETAEAANRAKSQFLANMSHELRTPLNAIIGYSEMLQEQAQDLGTEASIGDLQKIHSAGKQLQTLIDDILDLSKIEAGKMELFVETFDVGSMVQDIITTIKPLVEQKSNTLEISCQDELGFMRGDMTKVRQVLFNLLSNACKFTEKGAVSLRVTRQSAEGRDFVVFRVTDSGIGMTEEQIARLFQDFTQVDASTTRKYGGTGLGLAISRRFCEMMEGNIAVESVFGKGSTFTFRIPASIDATGLHEPEMPGQVVGSSVPQPSRASMLSPTVLVIDDDPVVHDLLARLLAKEGFRAIAAMSGHDGLRLAREVHPDAITLDVMMPGMDGWAVLSALKGDAKLAKIPVVLVTMTDDKKMGLALGASDYVTKPIDPTRLVSVLKKYTSKVHSASVLIVDDDPVMRDITGRLLRKEGLEVVEAGNGRVALQQLAKHTPTVIVLDLMMPELDGFGFITELRSTTKWQDIPIVVVTAKDITDTDRLRLDGFVRKILRKSAYRRDELLLAVVEQVRTCVQLESVV
jgi:PAS domain S-box-containing protein